MNEEELLKHLRAMKCDTRLESDLWARVRLGTEKEPPRFSIWDWAIAATLAAAFLLYPELAAALLYHI